MTSSAPRFRPVLIYGAGIHLSGAEKEAVDFAHRMRIPVCPTWAALDLLPSDDPLCVGSFGTHGTRAGNFTVQNATHIQVFGSRLDSKATGTPVESFAPKASIVMHDIDQREIDKFNGRVTGICRDVKESFQNIYAMEPAPQEWLDQINRWKIKYPVVRKEYYEEQGVNPYVFISQLSEETPEGTVVCTDTGCAVAWVSQAWKWKRGQRFIHAFNQTPMGYGLPAAVGAAFAGKKVVLVTGDGSLMMSIGELATVAGHKLPIKIFLLNNQGHGMCRQTQREWLGSTYPSTSIEGGLTFPEFRKVALGSGISKTWAIYTMQKKKEFDTPQEVIQKALECSGPALVEMTIHPDHDVIPKVKYGHANHDAHPLLPPEELEEQMCAN